MKTFFQLYSLKGAQVAHTSQTLLTGSPPHPPRTLLVGICSLMASNSASNASTLRSHPEPCLIITILGPQKPLPCSVRPVNDGGFDPCQTSPNPSTAHISHCPVRALSKRLHWTSASPILQDRKTFISKTNRERERKRKGPSSDGSRASTRTRAKDTRETDAVLRNLCILMPLDRGRWSFVGCCS